MAAMRFEQVQRFILAKKYFGVRGALSFLALATHRKSFFQRTTVDTFRFSNLHTA